MKVKKLTSIYFISKTFTENRNNNSWYYWYMTTVMPLQEDEQQHMIMGRGKCFVISLPFSFSATILLWSASPSSKFLGLITTNSTKCLCNFHLSFSLKRKAEQRWEIGPRREAQESDLSPGPSLSFLPPRDLQSEWPTCSSIPQNSPFISLSSSSVPHPLRALRKRWKNHPLVGVF